MFNVLITLWVVSLALGQFGIVLGSEFGGLYFSDIFAGLFVLYGFIYLAISPNRRIILPKVYIFFLLFFFWNVISLIFNSQFFSLEELVFSSFYFIRLCLYILAGILIFNGLREGVLNKNFIFLTVFYALALVFSGFAQLIFFPNFSLLDPSLGWDPHINRLLGTLFDPNFMGATLVFCFNIIFSWVPPKKYSIPFSLLLSLILLAILLTFSRSAWLMLAVSIFLWGVIKDPKLLLISLLIGFLAYFAVPRVQTRISSITDPADSAHFRFISWLNTLDIARNNFILGTGYNTFRFVQKDTGYFGLGWGGKSGGGSDSSLLLIMATTGIPGLFLFCLFLFYPLFSSFRVLSSRILGMSLPDGEEVFHNHVSYAQVMLVSFPALVVNSFFINSFFYPQIMFLWNLVLGGFIFSCNEP